MSRKLDVQTRPLSRIPLIIAVLVIIGFAPLQHARGAFMSLSISPPTAFVGNSVVAFGQAITGNGEVRVYLENLLVATTVSDETGYYSVEFNAPAVPANTYFMMAADVEAGETAYASLSVEPKVAVTPAGGSFDGEITVKGDGFAAFNYMTLWIENVEVYPYPSQYTNPLGSFEASFRVPSMPNGTYVFKAQDESGNTAATFFTMNPKIVTQPVSAPSGTFVFVNGYGFAASSNLTVLFDDIDVTPYSHGVVWDDGSFSAPFFVPAVQDGIYLISAFDAVGNAATAPFVVPSPIMTLSPDVIFGSSLITVEGIGFQPGSAVRIYFEDTLVTGSTDPVGPLESVSASIVAPVQGSGDAIPDDYGSFEYSFVVPTSAPGRYHVTVYQAAYSFPFDFQEVDSAILTIIDKTQVDVEATTGSIHFRGELAEFYVKTSLGGELVDVHFNEATMYLANGTSSQNLLPDVSHISAGFYRIPFTIDGDAPLGTYAFLVEVSYRADLIEASGAASTSFLISPTLTSQFAEILSIDNDIATIVIPDLSSIRANLTAIDARLVDVQGQVATIQSDLGELKADVEAINATLVGIEGNIATIQSDLGTLETDASAINASLVSIMGTQATIQSSLGTLTTSTDAIHAEVTSIDDGVATVESDIGTVKVRVAESGSQMNTATMFAIAAAIASISTAAVVMFTRRTPKPPSTPMPTQPSQPPPPQETQANVASQAEEKQTPETTTETAAQAEAPVEKAAETTTQTQTETPPEKPNEETSQPETTSPPPSSTPDPGTSPESNPPEESKPQDQPQPEPQTEIIVVHPEEQPPQEN